MSAKTRRLALVLLVVPIMIFQRYQSRELAHK